MATLPSQVSDTQAQPVATRSGGPGGFGHTVALLELLLTVGYVDGVFHQREHAFIERYLDSLLIVIEASGAGGADERARLRAAWQSHLTEQYARLQGGVAQLADETTLPSDPAHIPARLKSRAVALFRGLPAAEQTTALELVRALMHADGLVSPPEQALYEELLGYFAAAVRDPTAQTLTARAPSLTAAERPIALGAMQRLPLLAAAHPLLDPLEQTFSPHPVELQAQVALDYQLAVSAMGVWQRLRAVGDGLLDGVTDIARVPTGAQFLDRHVHVIRPTEPVEVIVVGDLHGCYGCLKAVLLQTNFVNRVWARQWDPTRHGDVKLVFLGDYIDRGRFSFDGVLRAVLQLLVAMPDNVFVLRGNHEYFHSSGGRVWSGVHPAEALASLSPHVPREMLEAYRVLFEHMPTAVLLDRTLLVHGGVPRDDTLAEHWRDLASLNHPELRFQMMWSDPEQVDHVPLELQRASARFGFGRAQFQAFMEKAGLRTMIRGHEKIDRGFDVVFDLGDRLLLNLFTAGGYDNRDLPVDSSYRGVRPMALTIFHDANGQRAVPWPVEYQAFNSEVHNGLHRRGPLLPYRYG
jgi:hypothetical protein